MLKRLQKLRKNLNHRFKNLKVSSKSNLLNTPVSFKRSNLRKMKFKSKCNSRSPNTASWLNNTTKSLTKRNCWKLKLKNWKPKFKKLRMLTFKKKLRNSKPSWLKFKLSSNLKLIYWTKLNNRKNSSKRREMSSNSTLKSWNNNQKMLLKKLKKWRKNNY